MHVPETVAIPEPVEVDMADRIRLWMEANRTDYLLGKITHKQYMTLCDEIAKIIDRAEEREAQNEIMAQEPDSSVA